MNKQLTTYKDWIQLLELADKGDNVAQYEVACYFDFGLVVKDTKIVEENHAMAFKWYHKTYENGNTNAMIRLADFLSEGIYCKQDLEFAIELYKKGIDNGHGLAANNLATLYRDQQDYKKAFELYQVAQRLDNSCSLSLAICYYFGIGTEKNISMSFELFNNISNDIPTAANCQYDIDEANYFLAKIYLDGDIVEKSIDKARIFLKLANTDDDHRSAQNLLVLIGEN